MSVYLQVNKMSDILAASVKVGVSQRDTRTLLIFFFGP